jgi:hypothetical protein
MSIYSTIVFDSANRHHIRYFQSLHDSIDYVIFTLTDHRLTYVNTLEELSKLTFKGKWTIQKEEYDSSKFVYLADVHVNSTVYTTVHRDLDMAIHRVYQRLSPYLLKRPAATPSTLREMNTLSLPEEVSFRIILSIIE